MFDNIEMQRSEGRRGAVRSVASERPCEEGEARAFGALKGCGVAAATEQPAKPARDEADGGPIKEYQIIVAGHGSRDGDGIREFEELVDLLRKRAGERSVHFGYLEFARPTIREAVRSSIAAGARCLVILPALLAAATHAKNDMPVQLQELSREFPDVELHFGAAMDLHPLLLALCRERIVEAESWSPHLVHRRETCLVVVGRGTNDSDANSDISKLARMLEEGMGFGSSFVCYSGTARPLVADGLKTAARLGYRRLIVLPYMLFDGVLVKRIYAATDALAKRHADLEVLKADYLGVNTTIADVFLERAQEAIAGRAHMNCSLCKYRAEIVGYEHQIAEPQVCHTSKTPLDSDAPGSTGRLDDPPVENKNTSPDSRRWLPYEMHPIEAESMKIIEGGHDWSAFAGAARTIAQRLVHTSGDFSAADNLYISAGAPELGIRALLRCRRVVTDVTMVESGLKRELLEQLSITTWCGVHEKETKLMSAACGITRSAAGIRRAWQKWGNDVVLAIGDAPTAVLEAIALVKEHGFRPQLIIGLPVGFVGTQACKDELRRCLQVPRITNSGTRGGSPWAAAVVNALLIETINKLAAGA